jgi:hypothetical protein
MTLEHVKLAPLAHTATTESTSPARSAYRCPKLVPMRWLTAPQATSATLRRRLSAAPVNTPSEKPTPARRKTGSLSPTWRELIAQPNLTRPAIDSSARSQSKIQATQLLTLPLRVSRVTALPRGTEKHASPALLEPSYSITIAERTTSSMT